MAPKIDVLSGASNVTIQGSQFNSTQIVGQSLIIDPALEILHKYQALEATHTSKTAASAPKCKPGTRARAVEDIMRWATGLGFVSTSAPGPDSEKSSRRSVGWGSIFFSTRVQGLDDEAPFVATIVSQLIADCPALNSSVLESIRSNPTIFEQSLDLQLEKLVLDQFASIPPAQSTVPKILIVDGLDECRIQEQRKRILQLLHCLVTSPFSFRVIIASRPEFDLRTAFSRKPFKLNAKILHLEEYDAYWDIYNLLSDEFLRIRETHPAKESLPSDWPDKRTESTFDEIPVIDIADAYTGDPSARRYLADQIRDACVNGFFSLPDATKTELDIHKSANFKGYTALLGENTDVTGNGDLHEGFDMGYEPKKPSDTASQTPNASNSVMSGENVWPEGLPGFRDAVLEYYHSALDLGRTLFPLFALALDLPEDWFADKCFTILWQDKAGGLQVKNTSDKWIDAVPIPGTVVVNYCWADDVFKSTPHRVINRSGHERYSIPLFFGTNYDVLLEPISTCISPDCTPKYEVSLSTVQACMSDVILQKGVRPGASNDRSPSTSVQGAGGSGSGTPALVQQQATAAAASAQQLEHAIPAPIGVASELPAVAQTGLSAISGPWNTSPFNVEGMVVVITGGGTGDLFFALLFKCDAGCTDDYYLYLAIGFVKKFDRIIPLQGDITDRGSLLKLAETVKARHGYVDLLVNNAGIAKNLYPHPLPPPSSDSTPDIKAFQNTLWDCGTPQDFADVFATNVTAPYYTTVAFLDLLHQGNLRRQRLESPSSPVLVQLPYQTSQVLTVSSSGGFRIDSKVLSPSYTLSKAACTHLGKMLSNLLAPWAIRSNVLAPGVFPSEMTMSTAPGVKLDPLVLASTVPLKRTGTEEDMAGTILFLASRAGAYVNGAVWLVDGGRVSNIGSSY
ncbi:hypothetical protein H1R20_g14659, partial [Candolleomyces eurysporus]